MLVKAETLNKSNLRNFYLREHKLIQIQYYIDNAIVIAEKEDVLLTLLQHCKTIVNGINRRISG